MDKIQSSVTMDKTYPLRGLLQKPSTCRCSAGGARPSGELGSQSHIFRAIGESWDGMGGRDLPMGHLLFPGPCASILKAPCPVSGSADGKLRLRWTAR